ncbi:MAG: 50S ribosomal protein L9 [Planctomycetota bacterium]|jgi:large subunit ribosomal protein L9
MAKNIELLLTKSVENLGIVGDIVRVKPGFARNFLLPHGFAEFPTPSKIESLKEARAKAQAELAELRAVREGLVGQLEGVSIRLERSCNDQGVLYGSVTQRDIVDALAEAGYGVDVGAVRLSHPIRHVDSYTVPIQFDDDLRTEITVVVDPDRPLEQREETETEAEAEPGQEAGAAAAAEAPGDERGERRKGSRRSEVT